MKNTAILTLFLTLILMASCTSTGNDSQAIGTLEPVPSEYAGLTNPFGADAAIEGASVFKAYCETCHGAQGHGDGPAGQSLDPRPQDLFQLQAVAGDDYLFWRIAEGKPGTSMVAWRGILNDEQIWQAVAFIRTLQP